MEHLKQDHAAQQIQQQMEDGGGASWCCGSSNSRQADETDEQNAAVLSSTLANLTFAAAVNDSRPQDMPTSSASSSSPSTSTTSNIGNNNNKEVKQVQGTGPEVSNFRPVYHPQQWRKQEECVGRQYHHPFHTDLEHQFPYPRHHQQQQYECNLDDQEYSLLVHQFQMKQPAAAPLCRWWDHNAAVALSPSSKLVKDGYTCKWGGGYLKWGAPAYSHDQLHGEAVASGFQTLLSDRMLNAAGYSSSSRHLFHESYRHHHEQLQQQQHNKGCSKLSSLEEVKGKIAAMAMEQRGCRFLQQKFDEGSNEDIEMIYEEIILRIADLITDPFGNYLVQKVLDVCSDSQRMGILESVTVNAQLVAISLDMHGTRAVQKLIDTLQTPAEIDMVISSLKPGIVALMKDPNGNHVVQRCLLKLRTSDNQFIFEAALVHCVDIARTKHGCCVLQRCIDAADEPQHNLLIIEVATNTILLSQDPYGNYAVQYVLDLGYSWATTEIIARMAGSFPQLAMQKFSSNVVERCLKTCQEEHRPLIIQELIGFPSFCLLLHHEYANYVIQTALSTSKGDAYASLVAAIRPHVAALRSSPCGKRILSRANIRK